MSVTVATLVAKLTANTADFDRGLDQAGMKAQTFGKSFGAYASAGAVAAGAAVVAFGVHAFNSFASFERQMNEVFTVLPGISKTAMDDMTSQVKSFAIEFGVLPEKVVPALYQALSRGVPKENVFTFLETAQGLAKAGVTDLQTAVEALTTVTNAYGLENLSAKEAADILFTGVIQGGTKIDELAATLGRVVPVAASMGIELGTVVAAVDALTKSGLDTGMAVTGMTGLFKQLGTASGATGKIFKDLSGVSFPDFIANGGTLAGALKLMNDGAGKAGVSFRDMFTDMEGQGAALILAGEGADDFAAALDASGSSAGSMQGAVDQMNSGVSDDLERMKAGFAVFAINVGGWLAEHLMPIFEGMAAWWEENGPGIMVFAEAVGTTITTVFTIAGDIVTGFIGFVVAMVKGVAAAWDELKAAAGAVKDWIVEKWDAMMEFLTGIPGRIGSALSTMWDWVKDAATSVKTWVADRWEDILTTLRGMPGKIATAASGMWDGIKKAFKAAVNFIIRGWNRLEFKIPGFGLGPIKFDGFTLGVPDIPELGAGGIVSAPTLALIGEKRQTEIVTPERLMRDVVADALKQGGNQPMSVTIPIVLDGKEIARYVWDRHGMTSQMARAS